MCYISRVCCASLCCSLVTGINVHNYSGSSKFISKATSVTDPDTVDMLSLSRLFFAQSVMTISIKERLARPTKFQSPLDVLEFLMVHYKAKPKSNICDASVCFTPFRTVLDCELWTKIQTIDISAAAVFPTLALHDHEKVRATADEQDRRKKFHQSRGSLR